MSPIIYMTIKGNISELNTLRKNGSKVYIERTDNIIDLVSDRKIPNLRIAKMI